MSSWKKLVKQSTDALVTDPQAEPEQFDPTTHSAIWTDGPLKYFVLNKRHLSGISRKTKNRVERLAKYYEVYEDGLVYYIKDEMKLLVPTIDERLEIVTDAQVLGHFGVQATYDRVREEFFWPRMLKDVNRICKSCTTCKKFNDGQQFDSLAKPSVVSSLFEKAGMDIVTGFPETKDGFKHILVLD